MPVDSTDRKQKVSINAIVYSAKKRNALAYRFSAIRSTIGTSVMMILTAHSRGVVALIITTADTTRIIYSFVLGSSLIFIKLSPLFQNAF